VLDLLIVWWCAFDTSNKHYLLTYTCIGEVVYSDSATWVVSTSNHGYIWTWIRFYTRKGVHLYSVISSVKIIFAVLELWMSPAPYRSDVSATSDSDVGDQQMLITVLTNFQNFVDVPFISTCSRYPVHERFPLSSSSSFAFNHPGQSPLQWV